MEVDSDSAFVCDSSGISLRRTTLFGSIMSRTKATARLERNRRESCARSSPGGRLQDFHISVQFQDVPGKVVMIRPAWSSGISLKSTKLPGRAVRVVCFGSVTRYGPDLAVCAPQVEKAGRSEGISSPWSAG